MKRLFSVLLIAVFLIAPAAGAQAATWYVKTDGSDPGDCTGGHSWGTAYATIQEAIDCATAADEIWVKQGDYNLSAYISVDKAVSIYGGFAGTESALEDRDWATHTTTVDGKNLIDHCFYVTDSATIDGFTITGGNAHPTAPFPHNNGGGICNDLSANPSGLNPTIANCTIVGNHADYGGGGIFNYYCWFLSITNCIVSGNTSWVGGGIDNVTSDPTITNCSISGNTVTVEGGGIYNYNSFPTITNCILWGDSAPNGPEIYNDPDYSNPNVTYCDVQGGYPGTGNINSDPLFLDAGGGDFHLQYGSPCIDKGNNTPPTGGLPSTDFEGDPRIVDGPDVDTDAEVDMGADEYVILNFVILHKDGALWYSDTGWLLTCPPYYPGTDYARDVEFLDGGDYGILHKDGAIYNSVDGWITDTPPYYPGSTYAVDIEVTATEECCILHKDGALNCSDTGWVLTCPPYYPGTNYARALELSADGSYVILHRDGAIYDSASSWVTSTPPYYPGAAWAVDMELDADGSVILHRGGALWSTGGGWLTTCPPYYPGTDNARDLELVRSRYIILHKDGALYDSFAGWVNTCPPYYAGSNYAVDLEVR